jgi:two-component system chemotaxis response regulator CheB
MTAKVRVLVVEDSLTVREHILAVLRSDPEFEVVGQAADGRAAIELCQVLRPDVVSMDMHMPLLDGLATTEHIMAHFPTPILIVSASTNRGDLFRTYDALAAGAVDVVEKLRPGETDRDWNARFLAALRLVSRIKVITHPRARLAGLLRTTTSQTSSAPTTTATSGTVFAVGASTGGPAALVSVLGSLPRGPGITTLLVQHIDELFAAGFSEWLGGQCKVKIGQATAGEPLLSRDGGVRIAPANSHLVVRDGRLWLDHGPPRHSCRPSIDVLFESLASECGPRTVACLLTGMGKDGARGLLAIRKAGGRTFAQDESTSVVYGMPREAVHLGAAERILPIGAIGVEMARAITGGG